MTNNAFGPQFQLSVLSGSYAGLDIRVANFGNLINSVLAWDEQFYNWAWDQSQQLALEIPNDQLLPFNAMTISSSIAEGQGAFDNFILGWFGNQQVLDEIYKDFSQTTLSVGNFYDFYGNIYELPYEVPFYGVTNNGYIVGSYEPLPYYTSDFYINPLTPLF